MLGPPAPMEPDEELVIATLLAVLWSRVGRACKTDEAPAPPTADDALPCWLRDLVSQEQAAVELMAGRPEASLSVAEGLTDQRSHRAAVLLRAPASRSVTRRRRPCWTRGDRARRQFAGGRAGRRLAGQGPVPPGRGGPRPGGGRAASRGAAGPSRVVASSLPRRSPGRTGRMLRTEASLASAATWLCSPGPLAPPKLVTITQDTHGTPAPIIVDALSARETEVLRHLADLLTTEEVAATSRVGQHRQVPHPQHPAQAVGVAAQRSHPAGARAAADLSAADVSSRGPGPRELTSAGHSPRTGLIRPVRSAASSSWKSRSFWSA